MVYLRGCRRECLLCSDDILYIFTDLEVRVVCVLGSVVVPQVYSISFPTSRPLSWHREYTVYVQGHRSGPDSPSIATVIYDISPKAMSLRRAPLISAGNISYISEDDITSRWSSGVAQAVLYRISRLPVRAPKNSLRKSRVSNDLQKPQKTRKTKIFNFSKYTVYRQRNRLRAGG